MAAPALPPLPPQLKSIQHHLRTAQELDKREPVVAYYCRLYAMQTGMKIDSKTPECRKFLSKLMDQLEAMKKQFGDNEAITQEIVGSAHVENYALKMFLYADNEDRAGQFHKNMIKSFYTASLLIDVLTVFGELSEENAQHRKYARWKAAYIHNCLKNGETPQPGPIGMEGESFADAEREEAGSSSVHSGTAPSSSSSTYEANNIPTSNYTGIHIPPGAHAPANTPAEVPHNTGVTSNTIQPAPQNIPLVDPSLYSAQSAGEVRLTPEDFARAQKYCKYAGSALQYEDVSTAVQNLQKALKLLITGRE
ncbi:vacuolar protein sorting-associated protein VTA1 homolog isoform X1 [Ammospiza nelsoni]|uniref:vacuolar protein sorting-associated protein VTA1 homolog isoform X3 n=1 Tax=Ammospiza caudacuta TaxID=2857398 RepID=UPI002738D0B6|nr:vacuolar protein sorting-associated protein VTA1 homolog isoform X3 [Ammospiza caudacuta]XP_059323893.1 vacuolar protein sorting-associated protein VTA1 homolog isoform X1 [Ammospiza nelsoni]XP_059697845.1 vacuolar protein sorting-associated protein VTA1 homolog isoform X1 [Haemorhous mexicanus]